jgi:translocation-and-assembly-module (TAM) inner membrane subunit TamB-like protein
VAGSGVVRLKGLALDGYEFNLVLRDFTAQETGLYAAEFDGRFTVANGERVRGQTLPHVAGSVEMRHAVILLDFANQTETERLAATTQPLFWTYRVQVNATSNLHWQPPDGDIDFSADLMIEQTPDSLLVYGDMRALRGSYYFLSNRFDVRQADLTFDNLEGVNPVLEVEATTRVKEPAPGSCTTSGAQEITARITGRADEPVVAFTSTCDGWDEPSILRELTYGRFLDTGGAFTARSAGDPLDSYVTQAINRTLSAEMSRTFKGYVNEWVLERERGGLLTGEGNVIVGVGVPVNRNLQIRYRQRVPGLEREYGTAGKPEDPFERNVEAEYRLNRFFFVTTELKQRRILTGSTGSVITTPDFNVNLKARWEY